MIRLIIVFMTFFALDNIIVIFLPLQPLVGNYLVIPNAFLSCLCLFTFYDRGAKYENGVKSFDYKGNKSFLLALVFGVLYDIFYTGVLGVYTCLFCIIVYILRKFFILSIPINILSMVALMTGVIIFEEWAVFFLASTIIHVPMAFLNFVQYVLFPSLFFNGLLMLFIYPILTSQFRKCQQKFD